MLKQLFELLKVENKSLRKNVRPRYRPSLEPLEDRLSPAVFTWQPGNGGERSWSNANSWRDEMNNPGVPLAQDTAQFLPAQNPEISIATIDPNYPGVVGSIIMTASFNGYIKFARSLTVNHAINQTGARIGDPQDNGNLTLADGARYTFVAGTLSGRAEDKLIVSAGAFLSLTGGGQKLITGRGIDNQGTAYWDGSGNIVGAREAVFRTFAGAGFERVEGSADMVLEAEGASARLVIDSGGCFCVENSAVKVDWMYQSAGDTHVHGTLTLQGGMSLGGTVTLVNLQSAAHLNPNPITTHVLANGLHITGPGRAFIETNPVEIGGQVTVTAELVLGATLEGLAGANLKIGNGGVLSWVGTLQNVAQTNILPGGKINTGVGARLDGGAIYNDGLMVAGSSIDFRNGAIFFNKLNGVVQIPQDGTVWDFSQGAVPKFINEGTVWKNNWSLPEGHRILLDFENRGLLKIEWGKLIFHRKLLQTSGETLLLGMELEVFENDFEIQAGTLRGEGEVIVRELINRGSIIVGLDGTGTINVQGNYTQVASGTLSIAINTPPEFGQLNVTGLAKLGGTLQVSLLFVPQVGDVFTIMTWGSLDPLANRFASHQLSQGLFETYGETSLTVTYA